MQSVEFTCQYSDQVRKKHKTWHDGKLKLLRSAKRFTLYSLEDKKALGSTIMTSDRDLERVLDTEAFGTTEHRLFARYVVIVCEEMGKHQQTRSELLPVAPKRSEAKTAARVAPSVSTRNAGDHPLALKMNRPFKSPRLTTQAGRPSVRQRAVKEGKRPNVTNNHRGRIRQVNHQPIML